MTQSAYLDFGGLESLRFEETPRSFRLWPAVGGAQLGLDVRVAAGRDDSPAPQYHLSAVMQVGLQPNIGMRDLCQLSADSLVAPGRDGTVVTFRGIISDTQLRAMEQLRGNAEDLWIGLKIRAMRVEELPSVTSPAGEDGDGTHTHQTRLVARDTTLSFALSSGEWLKAWEQAAAGSFLEILVPLPGDPDYAKAVGRIATARKLVHGDHLEDALGEARMAIEPVRRAYKTVDVAKAARDKSPRERDKNERWALVVEDLFALLSGAVHDDPDVTEHFVWNRAETLALVAAAAGLLGKLAEER